MTKSKKRVSMTNVVYLLIILISLSNSGCGIVKQIDNELFAKEISVLNLTQDQKVEDFEELYNNMIESVPSLGDHKALYNIDFEGKKDYYLDLIKNTQNDFEFYCTMSAIHEDIPGMHTDIVFPDYSDISDLGCYNQEKMLGKKNLKPLTDYWYNCIGEACEQFSEVQCADFKYIDGQYLFDPMDSAQQYQGLRGFELTSINNESMTEYAVNHISYHNLKYDTARNVSYRTFITLNDREGEKVNVTLSNSETGKTINKELYMDIKMEVVNWLSYIYEEDPNINTGDYEDDQGDGNRRYIYSYSDDKGDIGYVKIEDFMNSQGEELVTTLKSMKELSNIIIDLRGNSGGYRDYGQKYLYSPLHSEDVTMRYTWFVPASDANKSINNSMFNRFLYGAGKEGVGFNYTREYTYTGDSEATDQSIYYLINGYTGSAADGYVGMIKEKKLGTIIGSSADGEGLADSFICHSLKNSGLVYIYFPSLCYNQDGSNNSLYGTSPDIYIEPTKEGFYQQRDLSEKGIDISIYTEKVKYDNVLIKVIEIIQEDNKFY